MEKEHLEAFERNSGNLVRIAREVAEYAYSYRGFKVGCAVLAWRPKGIGLPEKYRIFKAANAKPIEGKQKFCGEMTTACYAWSNGYTRIIAIAVAGLPQADGGSGILSETLHPCEVCRPFLAAFPAVTRDTKIVTVHNHSGLVREFTLEEIMRIHDDPIPWEAALT